MLALAILVVLLPSLATNQYSSGFLAFQEHRWQAAVKNFQAAAWVNPLSAQYRWMLSKAELELGHFDRAAQHLARAIALKRGYSPYLSQAGWLAWLNGDLEAAERYFEEAIAADPLEGWTSGLHANLGLLRAHQGRQAEAIEYFTQSFAYHPELAAEAEWVKLQTDENGSQVFLAPTYSQAAQAGDLQQRIFAHLGMADITTRHFEQPLDPGVSLSLEQVFDRLHEQYLAGISQSDPDAHLLLAAEAEAARQSGLLDRAEKVYQEYQALRPNSAFGYRDLGRLLFEHSRLDEAETWLNKALEVSPENIEALRLLSQVQVMLQKTSEAETTFARLMPIASGNSFQLQFFNVDLIQTMNQVAHASGDTNTELQAVDWLAKIQATADSYLALANLAQEQGHPEQAVAACWKGYQTLLSNWVRPYDGRLWTVADCVAQSTETEEHIIARLKGLQSSFTNLLFLGHISRQRGSPELSAAYYQQAADSRHNESAPYYYLGELLASQGQTAEAELEYIRASELESRETLPLLALGRLYEGIGNSEGALAAYQNAVLQTPGWDEAQLTLGNFYLKSGDFNQAGTHFKLARQLSGEIDTAEWYDFTSNLASATLTENVAEGYIKTGYYEINGERKFSIFMHPVSAAAYELKLPELEAGDTLWLDFALGMLPDSWTQAGDGVNFSVDIRTTGEASEIYSSYLDPKNNLQDRQWRAARVDLSAYAGQEITVILRTDGGEAGDLQFDWACWGEPAILVTR